MKSFDFSSLLGDALEAVSSVIDSTPLIASGGLSAACGGQVFLKPECLQVTGSFKIRGAASRMWRIDEAKRGRGVVTASSGNHGRAVAYVARELGIPATVCISDKVVAMKREAIAAYGARVEVVGDSYEAAEKEAQRLEREEGMTFVSAFDDPRVIAGQGTVGLEILDECPDVDTVIVPLSGGGLASGVALALEEASSAARVVGISMERAPMMYMSVRAGEPVEVPEEETLADALMGSIGNPNMHTFDIVRGHLDDLILVSEEEIEAAMGWLYSEHGLVVEGGGAVGVAALRGGRVGNPGSRSVVVLSGGNVDRSVVEAAARGRTR